jgi:hypothetical protein
MQLLRDLAAQGVIALVGDAAGVAPHGVGGFEVLDREAFQRCACLPRQVAGQPFPVAGGRDGALAAGGQGAGLGDPARGGLCGTERKWL